jgi:hypothetical protein
MPPGCACSIAKRVTDAGGIFLFNDVPAGSLRLRVRAKAHAPAEYVVPPKTTQFVIALKRGGTLSGSVLDARGRTAAGIIMRLHRMLEGGGLSADAFAVLRSDSLGSLARGGIPEGAYRLVAFDRVLGRDVPSQRIEIADAVTTHVEYSFPAWIDRN